MHVYKCYDVDLTCLAGRGLSTIREDRVRWQEFVYRSAHYCERCYGKMTLLKEHKFCTTAGRLSRSASRLGKSRPEAVCAHVEGENVCVNQVEIRVKIGGVLRRRKEVGKRAVGGGEGAGE